MFFKYIRRILCMKHLLTVVVALSTVALVACEQAPKTVDYYVENQEEMDRVLEDCKNNAINPFGDSKEAQNCRAAADAQTQVFFTLPWEKKKEQVKGNVDERAGRVQEKSAEPAAKIEGAGNDANAANSTKAESGTNAVTSSSNSSTAAEPAAAPGTENK
jgi:hypothetical protein